MPDKAVGAKEPSQPATLPPRGLPGTPQVKLLSAVLLVVGIVLAAPHSLLTAGAVAALVVLLSVGAGTSPARVLLHSLFVLPVAGTLSLFLPLRYLEQLSVAGLTQAYAQHWPQMVTLIVTPWLCVLVMSLLAAVCSKADLLYALERLRLPQILVLLLTFIYRYIDVMAHQLRAARRSLQSRAPKMGARKQVLLYGNLAGSMLVRAYDRGQRIHAAMLSRGFTGVLPRARNERMGANDWLMLAVTVLFACALVLYH